ncbi:GerAB/ArcD/ProY family transporter [Pseudalkalibacillus decolorationis]|uniref:GerAB/ArcD/ProY family transporter n=1 Tax=Pseudalkalibacillus decolorationis TaxID=163879 RepID=UPI0021497AF4|nr:spore germination protein [Pseudalkalibacillus decolorationis]
MLENGKISVRQFTILLILFIVGGSILVVPSQLASEAKQDAWIAAILGLVLSLSLVMLYNALGSRFPDMTLAQYSEEILGKWIGKVVSLLFFFYFFEHTAGLLRLIGDFMTTQIMPETPIQAIHIIFLSIIIMGVRLRIEPIARASEIFFPWFILLFFILVISISPHIEVEKIQPIGEEVKPIVSGAFQFLGLPFLQLEVFLILYPYINRKKEVKKFYLLGTLIGGVFLIVITFLSIAVLGADQSTRQMYPSYSLARKINIGDLFQRVEAIMAFIWFITVYFKMAITFYASTLIFAQTFKLKDYRFLTFPLGIIIIVLSIVDFPNIVYFKQFIKTIWTPYSLTYGLFLPLVLLGVAMLRKKRGNSGSY